MDKNINNFSSSHNINREGSKSSIVGGKVPLRWSPHNPMFSLLQALCHFFLFYLLKDQGILKKTALYSIIFL